MSVASVAKLKYILLSLRHLNEGAIAVELDKLSVRMLLLCYCRYYLMWKCYVESCIESETNEYSFYRSSWIRKGDIFTDNLTHSDGTLLFRFFS